MDQTPRSPEQSSPLLSLHETCQRAEGLFREQVCEEQVCEEGTETYRETDIQRRSKRTNERARLGGCMGGQRRRVLRRNTHLLRSSHAPPRLELCSLSATSIRLNGSDDCS